MRVIVMFYLEILPEEAGNLTGLKRVGDKARASIHVTGKIEKKEAGAGLR